PVAPPEEPEPEREEPVPEPEPPPEAVVEPEPEPIVEPEPEPEIAEIPPEVPPPIQKPVTKPKPPEPKVVKPKPVKQPVAKRQPVPKDQTQEVAKPSPDAPLSPGGAEAYVPPDSRSAYLRNPKPSYPLAARKRQMEGLVLLTVEVSADGRPLSVRVTQSSRHSMLDNAALKAVSKWRFVPATRFGKPVCATIEVPVKFQLKG
ncbi:MAG: energy transducer TonB, partial [Rhodospirillales bacterium]|nr:energy transducer TonB [Rhodospirillales bacterium]